MALYTDQFSQFSSELTETVSKQEKLALLRNALDDPSLRETVLSFIDPDQRQGPKPESLVGIGPATIEAIRPGMLQLVRRMKSTPKFQQHVNNNPQYDNWYIRPIFKSIRLLIDLPRNLIKASDTFFIPITDSPLKTHLAVLPQTLVLDGLLYLTGQVTDYRYMYTKFNQGNCQEFSFYLLDYISDSTYVDRQNYLSSLSYAASTNILTYESPSLKSNVSLPTLKAQGIRTYFLYKDTGLYVTNNQSNPDFISVIMY